MGRNEVMRKFTPGGQHRAAFINCIGEEGDFAEAMEWLQKTWDDYMNLKIAIIKLGFTNDQVVKMTAEGSLGKVF